MSRIKLLAPHEAQKIAAGEVVERPANVVKELIENSLDAGATHITLYIEAGGKKLIRIVDNGCGMSFEDAHMCILPHATSKITSVDELDSLTTFGFRGEALASIASVSRMQIITKSKDASEGLQITIGAGVVEKNSTIAANTGTDITIEDIFYNVPARKKFLKTDKTEWHAIQQLLYAYALDYPEHQFAVYHNHNLILSCTPCATLEQRAQQLFDYTVTERLMPIHENPSTELRMSEGEVYSEFIEGTELHDWNTTQSPRSGRMSKTDKTTISGIISDHQYGRYDRSHIYLFVNRRWVKNYKLVQAIIKGYQGVLQQGQYPFAVFSITVPPHTIDINIHPRKEEVQFLNPRIIENRVQELVKRTLNARIEQRLQQPRVTHVAYQSDFAKASSDRPLHNTFQPQSQSIAMPAEPFMQSPLHPSTELRMSEGEVYPEFIEETELHDWDTTQSPRSGRVSENEVYSLTQTKPHTPNTEVIGAIGSPSLILSVSKDEATPEMVQEKQKLISDQSSFSVIGQFAQTYIMLETNEGLMMIDQHAAHERVLYEQIGSRMQQKEIIQLLFPEIIHLSPTDCALLLESKTILNEQGIEAEAWADNQILVTAAPVYVKPQALKDIIFALVAAIKEYGHAHDIAYKKMQHAVQAMIACKAAVKAHDILQQSEMSNLVQKLFAAPNKLACPHGRPTSWLITKQDIERKFKRIA